MIDAKELAEVVTVNIHGPDHTMYYTRKAIGIAILRAQADAVRSLAEHFKEVAANDPPVGMPGAYLEETIIEIIETRAKEIEGSGKK